MSKWEAVVTSSVGGPAAECPVMVSTTLRSKLTDNPRLVGVLFALFTLLAHAGGAAAVGITATHGP